MESGYTRKSRRGGQRRSVTPAIKGAESSYAERHGRVPRRRGLGKSTFELLKKTQGKGQLATEALEEIMLGTFALAQNHNPLDKHGNFRTRRNSVTGEIKPVGNLDVYAKLIEAAARVARRLAPYQSPKLARRATAKAPSELVEETSFTIRIFDPHGEHVGTVTDGVLEETKGSTEDKDQ
jgi:hypothetical protein